MAALEYEVCRRVFGNLAAAGTSEVICPVTTPVDMEGFDELTWIITFGDVTSGSVITITPKENATSVTTGGTQINLTLGSSASGLGTAAVITSNSLVVTAGATDCDQKVVVVTLKKSMMTKRYQFLSVTPATANAVIASVVAEQRAAKVEKITQHASVIATAYAAS